ncbi:MAG: ABC-2 transporter permease [Clostridia bacterium]|nr:ABC-2 transporter permease [Clostridia bacterium]
MSVSNIKNLVRKDMRLLCHPTVFLFFALACGMLFIPEYPRPVGFFYVLIAIMNVFTLDVQGKDHEFCGLLPVQKRESVLARVLTVALYELVLLVITAPFAFFSGALITKWGIVNSAGMNTNLILYAIVLLGYAAYNLIVIPGAYHKQFKVYFRSFIGMLAYSSIIALELLIHNLRGDMEFLNGTSASELTRQIPFLLGALAIFVIANAIAYFIASHRYEKAEI